MKYSYFNRPLFSMDNPELFKYKFGREPKIWKIEEVQELFDKLLERNEPFEKESKEIVKEIMSEIECDSSSQEERTVYYEKGDKVYSITFREDVNWDWSYTENGELRPKNREDNLDFLIDYDKKLKLGNKWVENQRYISNLPWRVREILHDMMNKKLLEYFKDKEYNKFLIENLVIAIGNKKYIATNRNKGNYHLDFKFEPYIEVSL